MLDNSHEVDRVLSALGEQLSTLGPERFDLAVCGGSALNALGLIRRTTKDVDVLAILHQDRQGGLRPKSALPLPAILLQAAERVGRDFGLPPDWLNSGPTLALTQGMPKGWLERLEVRLYGDALAVHFLSRYDQIHFKLYAAVDQSGKHYQDLLALHPTPTELEASARWTLTQDVSEPFKDQLKKMLTAMGVNDVARRL
jgi:hypothetical protein